jgi:peptide/nickel transport system substrate-binding protein
MEKGYRRRVSVSEQKRRGLGLGRKDFLKLSGGTFAGAYLLAGCDLLSTEPAQQGGRNSSDGGVAGRQGKESPMLAEMVKNGELPALEERLPENPSVVEPLEKVGVFGGTLRRAQNDPTDGTGITAMARASLAEWGLREIEAVPGIAESWEIEDDGRVYAFKLRRGMKWSDGEPFTADDLIFYYQDVARNETLTPAFPTFLIAGGKPVVIEKEDDYTVRFRFAAPNGLLLRNLAFPGLSMSIIKPRHYLSRFHPDHASKEELDRATKKGGFDSWDQLFMAKDDIWNNPERPVLGAWKISRAVEGGGSRAVAERNPYYWKVDTEGRQLPYVDRITYDVLEQETIVLRAANGEIDLQYKDIGFQNMPVLAENAERENIKILRWQPDAPWIALYMNQSHKDPDMRKLMQNRDFRAGLSHAINRKEMNEALFVGRGGTQHPCAIPEDPYYVDGYGYRFTEFDPGEANRLLDAAGLDRKDGDGFRVRPDGELLRLTVLTFPYETGVAAVDAYEFVKRYWERVGVRTEIKNISSDLWSERVTGNEHDIAGYTVAGLLWDIDPLWYVPTSSFTYWAPSFGAWYESGGKSGEKPPQELRRLQKLYDRMKATTDEEERLKLGREILKAHDENVYMIGTVTAPFQPTVVSGDMANVREEAVGSWRMGHEEVTWIEQVFYNNPEDH